MADPSPQERADYIVRKLEHFIRTGKGERGLSFKTWQGLARAELVDAFAEIEHGAAKRRADLTARRILLVGSASLVTIGFWGAVLTVERRWGEGPAVLVAVSGLVLAAMGLEFGLRRALARLQRQRRSAAFGRIEDFDRQLRRLESEIRRQAEIARKTAAEQP